MEIIRIESAENPYFKKVWEVYGYSFPLYEQRTLEHQLTAFKSNIYHMDAYFDGERLLGFIAYWVFPAYVYIEHYAMALEERGKGHGTRILTAFLEQMAGRIVVLEIDPVVDEVSTHRLSFYQRLGFLESPFRHQCPSYQPDAVEGELWVLTYPTTVDCDFYDRFYRDLQTVVMAR
ncbi:MAG: GNAT family N-acetyltransferase [Rikenellaceae bacterium]|jgi:GNAT superfamily N-acetyltransferase|nr:GNAT family N-acetyltransferase [Rikenellaceae bacterium]